MFTTLTPHKHNDKTHNRNRTLVSLISQYEIALTNILYVLYLILAGRHLRDYTESFFPSAIIVAIRPL